MFDTSFAFNPGELTVLLDGQAGSSGKGVLGSHLCEYAHNWQFACNAFAPQAGHWVKLDDGRKFFYQTLNSCAYMPDRYEKLYIGPGAIIELPALAREIEENNVPPHKLGISPVAAILQDIDSGFERGVLDFEGFPTEKHDGTMRAGSTAHGAGACRARRVLRRKEARYARDIPALQPFMCDVPGEIMARLKAGQAGLLEIAQGFQLSYLLPEMFPYCLSGDSRILMADGSTRKVRDLRNSVGRFVWSMDSSGNRVLRPILRWFKNPLNGRRWFNIITETSAYSRFDRAYRGAKFTEDHEVRTPSGIRCVRDLRPGDLIFTTEKEIAGDGLQILLGSFLGDGSVPKLKKSPARANYAETHCGAQKQYLLAKADILREYVGGRVRRIVAGKKSFKPGSIGWRYESSYTRPIRELAESCGCYGRKRPNIDAIFAKIDERGLAIWYQDDGQLKTTARGEYEVYFHVQDFNDCEKARIIDWCREKFGLTMTKVKAGRYSILRLARGSFQRFFGLVSRYVHQELAYKIPPIIQTEWNWSDHGEVRCATERIKNVVQVQPQNRRRGYDTCFCIEVGDTHNFFVSNDKGYVNVQNCTSRNCTTMAGMDDMMLPVHYAGNVIINLRTYPIRINSNKYLDGNRHMTWDEVQKYEKEGKPYQVVKYNSGPGYSDQVETTWEEVTKISGSPTPITEITSVTKLPRRVFTFSKQNLKQSIEYNRANGWIFLSINFVNYLDGDMTGRRGNIRLNDALSGRDGTITPKVMAWLQENVLDVFKSDTNWPDMGMCIILGTGPNTADKIHVTI